MRKDGFIPDCYTEPPYYYFGVVDMLCDHDTSKHYRFFDLPITWILTSAELKIKENKVE